MTYWSPIKLSKLSFFTWCTGMLEALRHKDESKRRKTWRSQIERKCWVVRSKMLCFKCWHFLGHFLKTPAIPGHMIPIPGRAGTQGLPLGRSLGFPEQNTVRREVIFHITFVQKGHTGDSCNRRKNTRSHRQPEARAQTAGDFFSAEESAPHKAAGLPSSSEHCSHPD